MNLRNTATKSNIISSDVEIRRVAIAIFILAATGMAFEVTLTRLFSLVFQYHYVFLVVSVAILGLGIGAAAGYIAQQLGLITDKRGFPTGSTQLLILIFPLVAFLLARHNSASLTVFIAGVAMLPFLLLGWINAIVYTRFSKWSNMIYGADLVGAAFGLVVVLGLFTILGPFGTTIALGVAVGIAAILMASAESLSPRHLGIPTVLTVTVIIITLANFGSSFISYNPQNISNASFDKTMIHILQDPSYDAQITATRWGTFAQVDVVQIYDPDIRYVFTDAGAGSFMLRYDPDAEDESYLDWLRFEPTYLPFEMGRNTNTLIVGAGAGRDIVLAVMAGAETITAVEINPAIVDITREQADYNGGILDLENVSTIIVDGRNFVDRSDEQFDTIYLNIVYSQAASPSSAALSESYIFTTEALESYWNRLSDDGQIAFVLHNGLEGVRLLMTAVQALEAEGMSTSEALSHIALVKQANETDATVETSVLLITRQSWTAESAQGYINLVVRKGLQPLFIPVVYEDLLATLLDGTVTFDEYLADNTDFNIYPTTDNHPFFYNFGHELPSILEDLLKWSALLTFGYLTIISIFQPVKPVHEWTRMNLALYFTLLGMGFMLIEVPLIQRFGLLLGNPVLAFVVTLGALLVGGGLGSLFSARYTSLHLTKVVALAALGVSLWVLAFVIINPILIQLILPTSIIIRSGVIILILLPLGFAIGMPFSSGLRLAGDADATGVPLFWGMNAIASTLGAVLATTIALLVGFQIALWLGAAIYLLVAGLVKMTWQRVLVLSEE